MCKSKWITKEVNLFQIDNCSLKQIISIGLNKILQTEYTCFFFFLCCRPVNLLTSQIQSIVRALHKQLREKSVKTRQVNTVSMNDLTPEYMDNRTFQGLNSRETGRVLILIPSSSCLTFLKVYHCFGEINLNLHNFHIYAWMIVQGLNQCPFLLSTCGCNDNLALTFNQLSVVHFRDAFICC